MILVVLELSEALSCLQLYCERRQEHQHEVCSSSDWYRNFRLTIVELVLLLVTGSLEILSTLPCKIRYVPPLPGTGRG